MTTKIIRFRLSLAPVFAILAVAAVCSAQTFPLPSNFGGMQGAALGSDGNVWFAPIDSTIGATISLASISPSGVIQVYPLTSNNTPFGFFSMAAGSDGNMWFAGGAGNYPNFVPTLGRVTPGGIVTLFTPSAIPTNLVSAPGGFWFGEYGFPNIGWISTSGVITEHTLTNYSNSVASPVPGPDGGLWFMAYSQLNRIDTATWTVTTVLDLTQVPIFSALEGPGFPPQFAQPVFTADGKLLIYGHYSYSPVSAFVKLSTTGTVLATYQSSTSNLASSNFVSSGGSIWFLGQPGALGSVSSSGITAYPTPAGASPYGPLVALPGGAFWFPGNDPMTGQVAAIFFTPAPVAGPLSSGKSCNGQYAGVFKGDVTVSSGQTCVFISGRIQGNVQVRGGSFTMQTGSITGNLDVQGGSFAFGAGSAIGGNVGVQQLAAGSTVNLVCGTTIGGNVEIHNNKAPVSIGDVSSCAANTISGNVEIHQNAAPSGIFGATVGGNLNDHENSAMTQVFSNNIGKNLQCQGNSLIAGGGNTAKSKSGQCAAF